jgi:hypothetical protein
LRRLTFLGVGISVAAATLALAHSGAGAASGKIIADSGFRPKVDGFSFENYGAGKADLSANEVRLLFGSRVCMFVKKSGACVLTPPGQVWLRQQNREMNGGHCTGMSVLSLLLFRHQFPSFGSRTYRLRLRGNVRLQRAIAYAFTWQLLPSVIDETVGGTPGEIAQKLISALQQRGGETYSLVLYKPGYEVGHEITPYAVEDRGHGLYDVLVYDNNWPGATRRLHIDTRNNRWSYQFEPGDVFRGNAGTKTLFLSPIMPGLGVHECPFCSARVTGETPYNELRLEGNPLNHAHLLITDDQGRRIGYLENRFVNEIPGASAVSPRTAMGRARQEPVYRIPAQLNMTVTIDGRGLRVADTEHLSMIGPGRDAAIDDLRIRPGDVSSFEVSAAVGRFAYRSAPGQTESPLFHIGLVGDGKGYRIGVRELSLTAGSLITSQNDRASGTLTFQDAGARSGTFEVTLVHYAQGKVRKLQTRKIQLAADQRAVVDYGSIRPGQTTIPITIS